MKNYLHYILISSITLYDKIEIKVKIKIKIINKLK